MTNRLMLDVALKPAIGSRFQPTGFPDLGSATFERFDRDRDEWVDALLVESAQSMANRLEGTAWDSSTESPASLFDGLPYVRVVDDATGDYLTSSRTEAHRLASAFIKDATLDGTSMVEVIRERLGLVDDKPLAPRHIAAALFTLDPFCLIHGVFFADNRWPGQPKITRALTAFVEAIDVRPADSGGVKKDQVRHSLGEGGGTAEGYGTVPFHRVEWTAREITASFALDLRQIHSYGLGEAATDLLEAVGLWEIRSLIEGGLRLRTACDLEAIEDPAASDLPSRNELEERIQAGIRATSPGDVIEVRWADSGKRKK